MGPFTDYVLIAVTLFSFWRGWNKNLVDLLHGPTSIVLAVVLGVWWYHHQSPNILISMGVGVAGPIVLRIITWALQSVFGVFSKKHENKSPSLIASLLSGCLNTAWGLSLFLCALVIIVLLPIDGPRTQAIQKDIKLSQTYTLLQELSNKSLPEKSFDRQKIKDLMKPIDGSSVKPVQK